MKSLFAKILLWFLATVVVTFVGAVAISSLTVNDWQPPFSRFLTFELNEARRAYEQGGPDGLREFVRRVRAGSQAEGHLTNNTGIDLLNGEDLSALLRAPVRPPPRIPFLGFHIPFWSRREAPASMARRAPDGKYWWVVTSADRRPPPSPPLFEPQRLWMLGIIVLLCYLLALHLTSPLRRLQKTLERFGQGDFSARAASTRRDELGQLARTFDQMAERLQTLLAAERRLLLDISHELRSPLARLGVAVELARSGENREAALNRIEKESDRLTALVGELLQVTRAEGDPAALHAEPVHLNELLEMIVDDCSVEATARGCSIQFHAAGPATVQGDPELLRRATENVIRNAVRFAPQESVIDVTLEEHDGEVMIKVRDNGPGVPDEALGRIFDPFYRVESDRNRATGGVGLGLSIARRAVELHKGRLRAVNSHPGLLVEMELPVNS